MTLWLRLLCRVFGHDLRFISDDFPPYCDRCERVAP